MLHQAHSKLVNCKPSIIDGWWWLLLLLLLLYVQLGMSVWRYAMQYFHMITGYSCLVLSCIVCFLVSRLVNLIQSVGQLAYRYMVSTGTSALINNNKKNNTETTHHQPMYSTLLSARNKVWFIKIESSRVYTDHFYTL